MKFVRILLLPVSIIYCMVVFVRNRLFDWGILKSREGVLPTIVIGNLSTGGTGKTPHAEYFLQLLSEMGINLALLSRGYGRKTQGFIVADEKATANTIGDEPFQIHTKFPQVPLAVSEDRLSGIEQLKAQSNAELVLLDDAFQHRKLKGDFNILLTTFQKPYWKDIMLPTGNLRDNRLEKRRADIILITKCPSDLTEWQMTELTVAANPKEGQRLFFSSLEYSSPVQISGSPIDFASVKNIVGFAGIAHPQLFEEYLKSRFSLKKFKSFADHYIFSQSDIESLAIECGNFGVPETVLVTTEKDAMRLKALNGLPIVPVFYVPVKVKILDNGESELKQLLKGKFNFKR